MFKTKKRKTVKHSILAFICFAFIFSGCASKSSESETIRSLENEINSLKNDVNSLKTNITDLEKKNSALELKVKSVEDGVSTLGYKVR